MERVTGIGGVFMRSRDPAALARWYKDHLGVDAYSEEADATWWQAEGPTVWAPRAAFCARNVVVVKGTLAAAAPAKAVVFRSVLRSCIMASLLFFDRDRSG